MAKKTVFVSDLSGDTIEDGKGAWPLKLLGHDEPGSLRWSKTN